MGTLKVFGLVCRYANYRDNDRMLTLFTREQGRLDVASRGCRRQGSPLLAASQPFVYAQFVLYQSKDRLSVNTADVLESFYPLRDDYDRFRAGLSVLALTVDGAREADPDPALFSTLYHTLSYLCYTDSDPCDLYFAFLLKYLDRHGYRPMLTRCAKCSQDLRNMQKLTFLASAGGAVCPDCGAGQAVSRVTLEAMRRMLQLEDEKLQKIRLPYKVRLELNDILPAYARCVLERRIRALEMGVCDNMHKEADEK